jgi:putative transcriptional regulator
MENKTVTFGNWSTEEEVKDKYKELFEEIYNDDGSLTALSKEVFEHYEPDEKGEEKIWFKYHLGRKVESMHPYLNEDEDGYDLIHFELFMVPLAKYLHKNKLKEIRTNKKISQEDLAKMIGTTRQTIISIEKNLFNPSAKLALLLCIALDSKFEDLFFF